MNKDLATSLERKLGISQEQVVRERYEIIILKKLFESELGKSFVFKGGTALRLAYGSPGFSEDLDFSVVADFNRAGLEALLKKITNQDQAIELKEALQKKYTYFGLFRIKEDFMNQAFSIKFEASTRPVNWKKGKDYQLQTLKSEVTNLTVLAQVATLKRIAKDKQNIKPPRIRDVFDLWFIGQKLDRLTPIDFSDWDSRVVKRELHKFLPQKNWSLLDPWL